MPLSSRQNGGRVLALSAVAASLTGSTTETVLATILIPGGSLGPNGALRIRTDWAMTSSANTKTLRARLGGIGSTAFLANGFTTVAQAVAVTMISNRNSEASQYASSYGTRSTDSIINTTAPITGTIDTTIDQNLVITGQLASAGETITLDRYLVELVRA